MHQVDVLDFVLNHDKFGLINIDGYGLKLFDMFLGDYGLPHQQWCVHIYNPRKGAVRWCDCCTQGRPSSEKARAIGAATWTSEGVTLPSWRFAFRRREEKAPEASNGL